MVSALNTSRRTSGSCPRFILASDCVRPPVPTSWFLPHAGLHLATEHSRLHELERGTRYRPVSPLHHLCPHFGDSWRDFISSDNGVNNTNYCNLVLKCLALSTTLILANWTETELNLESIYYAFGYVVWCFWYVRLNLQSESRKRWSSLQGRGQVVGGGTRHFGGIPPQEMSR